MPRIVPRITMVWSEVVFISYLRRSTVSQSRLPSINLIVSPKQVDGYWTLPSFIPVILLYVLVAEKRFKQSKFISAIYPKFIGCKYVQIWFKPASMKLWLPAHTRDFNLLIFRSNKSAYRVVINANCNLILIITSLLNTITNPLKLSEFVRGGSLHPEITMFE